MVDIIIWLITLLPLIKNLKNDKTVNKKKYISDDNLNIKKKEIKNKIRILFNIQYSVVW